MTSPILRSISAVSSAFADISVLNCSLTILLTFSSTAVLALRSTALMRSRSALDIPVAAVSSSAFLLTPLPRLSSSSFIAVTSGDFLSGLS